MAAAKNNGNIYTVSLLTREIKSLLEDRFPFVWILGEISNYSVPASGHSYFSLKDTHAVIHCVMFKNQKRSLKFDPENGLKIMGLARLSLYEPRGSYQLIFEHMEPEGAGSLHLAFEQLKKKLAREGLFDESFKQQIPFLPRKINVITSGTGAAVRDIVKVGIRRFPNCNLEIVPVKVQGPDADTKIVEAIEWVNRLKRSDVIILARGGGSMEDLSSFNSEAVARAIFASKIPIITGIGHETDFTIADFVADFRAPTPSAAAIAALPDKENMARELDTLKSALTLAMTKRVSSFESHVSDLEKRLRSPRRIMDDHRLRLEELELRMYRAFRRGLCLCHDRCSGLTRQLTLTAPALEGRHKNIADLLDRMKRAMHVQLDLSQRKIKGLNDALTTLDPASVLDRGYSIVRDLNNQQVIMDSRQVDLDQSIEIILSKGRMNARVEKKEHAPEKNI